MSAQAPDTLWTRIYSGGAGGNCYGYSVQQTTDGGFIIAGDAVTYNSGGSPNVWLIKTYACGNLEWKSDFGVSNIERGYDVQQTTDGGYIIVGYNQTWYGQHTDVWLIKTDASGFMEWERHFGGSDWDYGQSVQQTADGGYIIVGWTHSLTTGNHDILMVKTDDSGSEEWERTFGGSGLEQGYSVQQTTPDGGYIIAGQTDSYGAGLSDIWLIKTNSLGIEEWDYTFGGSGDDHGYSVQQTSDGGFIIGGDTDSYGTGINFFVDFFLVKTNASGIEEWSTNLDQGYYEAGRSVIQTDDGGYIIAGKNWRGGPGNSGALVIKTDASGIEVWDKIIVGGNLEGLCIQQTTDGGYVIAGARPTYSAPYNLNAWLIRLEGESTCTVSGAVNPPYAGLTIDLLDPQYHSVTSTITDSDGTYEFVKLCAEDYYVEMVEPLGFVLSENDIPVTASWGQTSTANFTLTPILTTNDARTKSYWKHQVNACISGNGNTDYTEVELVGFDCDIFEHFFSNTVNPIQIPYVTYLPQYSPTMLSLVALQSTLNINQGGASDYESACQQLTALLLNVVSGKLGQYMQASEDGATVSQAIVYINQILDIDGQLACDVAERLNKGLLVNSGIIPLTTPNVIFGNGELSGASLPLTFNFGRATPNPFNPSTSIRFDLPEAGTVSLIIYDVMGREITQLVDGFKSAGSYEVTFDGADLSSGVYFAVLETGGKTYTQKLLLLK